MELPPKSKQQKSFYNPHKQWLNQIFNYIPIRIAIDKF